MSIDLGQFTVVNFRMYKVYVIDELKHSRANDSMKYVYTQCNVILLFQKMCL